MNASDIAAYAGVVVVVLAALTAIIKSLHWVYVTMRRIDQAMDYVQHEMHYNGGATMRDAVARANRRLLRIEDALDIPHLEDEPPIHDDDSASLRQ